MPLSVDPEYYEAVAPLLPAVATLPKPGLHDVQTHRERGVAELGLLMSRVALAKDVDQSVHEVEAADEFKIPVYRFAAKTTRSALGPAILHCHGGGMILGSVAAFAPALASVVERTGVPVFSVEYRLAPEHQDTTLVDDCYAALVWLTQNAKQFNIDPARIAVMGESAGGGIAAGVALMARDQNLQPPLAKQILVYPMLDDRNMVADKAIEPYALWTNDDNVTGWTALLGSRAGKEDADVSQYAAPARAKSLARLPPTFIDVGGLDIFRDEDMTYATRLVAENIDVEFHLYPGVPHAFEFLAPETSVAQRAHANRLAAMQSF
ncbi:triacylglycerol lipase [Fonsecaea erecta]|uniref:Triacylglycerol lipase n=1 Tax=Fonsecaea erecta TaxID=1367422 RepID=A0A178Z3Q0_9EURO|nr:triacylglycerol lipase [Fonsecaea erecta]OAP53715.1 triacylglycerol lipase [Fonsecaea erecta]